jgi:hypothetical protein
VPVGLRRVRRGRTGLGSGASDRGGAVWGQAWLGQCGQGLGMAGAAAAVPVEAMRERERSGRKKGWA